MNKKQLMIILAAAAILSSCDVAYRVYSPDTNVTYRQFGERCEQHVECESTYCIQAAQGDFCTKPCEEGCPDGWSCQVIDNPHGEGTVSLCNLIQQQLCIPCTQNDACGPNNANWCIQMDNGSFCAMDCTYQSCPEGFVCSDVSDELGNQGRQCLPVSGRCTCDENSIGQSRGCLIANEFGTCTGIEVCSDSQDWDSCNARTPQAEICNGVDDNCDGFIDENLDGASCEITNEFGACPGEELCAGISGPICHGQTPTAELCNGADDNCDGAVDEDFRNADGIYDRVENCGACGQNCNLAMEHATSTECRIIGGQAVCRAVECEPGYFVYMDGVTCMALPSNLCKPCSETSDCVGPNSQCIQVFNDNGNLLEAFCGRDCSSNSPYGSSCPNGYECKEQGQGSKQCVPVTGTCICNEANIDSARSCAVNTCEGFEWCQSSNNGFTWSECTIDKYNLEICDGMDNDCDGQIDEGMRDPVTGLYTSPQHCGYCNNDCSEYIKPEIHHTEGVCKVVAGTASCGIGECTKEVINGTKYEWVNTDKNIENGCECRRLDGNVNKDNPDIADTYASGFEFVDENCDGIDGVIEDAIFVSRDASPNGNGTIAAPYQTISAAIKAWNNKKKYILVAEGIYEEDVSMIDGVAIHGGYSVNFRERDLVKHASKIRGKSAVATIQAESLTKKSMIDGFVIEGADRAIADGGKASIAIWLKNTDKVAIHACQISGGQGEPGKEGLAGKSGNGSNSDNMLNGGNGVNSERLPGPCTNETQSGGHAGINAKCPIANATAGGHTVCPAYDWATHLGNHADYPNNSQNRGIGGYDGSFDEKSRPSCSHITESGFPIQIQTDVAQDGLFGAAGANGRAGQGSQDAYGSFRNGRWVAAHIAQSGDGGEHGVAGGGGGAGGGAAYYYQSESDCPYFEIGPTGGGGGAGGCGGSGGGGGSAGGASIGLLITFDTTSKLVPEVSGNVFMRGRGGNGGNGGIGGAGGAGGTGGNGGIAGSWYSTRAGRGGNGGSGGRGGGGGGGAGGPSFDILGFNATTNSLLQANSFIYSDDIARGGAGGAGGIGGAEESGTPGINGASRRQLDLQTCSNNNKCPASYSCNDDNVCIPK